MPQYFLPSKTRFADRLHRWAIRRGFPICLRVSTRWPRWYQHLTGRWVIFLVFLVYPRPKRLIRRNLARLMGRPAGSMRVRLGAASMIQHFGIYWADLFGLSQQPEKASALTESVSGKEHLDAAVAAGRGAVLLTAHMGNWELGSVLLGAQSLPISIVHIKDAFADVDSHRRLLHGDRVEEISIEPGTGLSSLPVLRALRAGRLVAMQGDRDFDGRGIPASFCGEIVRFPRGPFVVALLTGAPVLPVFITYTESYRFEVRFGEPIRVASSGDRERDLADAVARWALVLEAEVRRAPTQWYTFYDYFAEHRASVEEASSPQREGQPRRRASA
jgi:KDO2-lipid IV(A) lauroyltransferase